MYQAKVNGQPIDVENLSLTFRLKNPMFDPNSSMEWSASYPFTLPNTPRNKSLFEFPARLSAKQNYVKDMEFEHSFDGVRLPGDTIRVKQTGNDKIEAYIKIGRSDFISINKSKLLTDLYFDAETYSGNDLAVLQDKRYPESTFAICPVLNEELFFGSPQNDWYIDPSRNAVGPYQNYFNRTKYSNFGYLECRTTTPFPYLLAVIDRIFSEAGYNLNRDFILNDTELNSLCIYNPNICEHDINETTITVRLNEHLPRLNVIEFIIESIHPFGCDYYFNHYRKKASVVPKKSVVNGTEIIEWSDKVSASRKVINDEIIAQYRFKMKSDDNDSIWSKQVSSLEKYKSSSIITAANVVSFPPYPSNNTIGYAVDTDSYYIFQVDPETGTGSWEFLSQNLQDYFEGTEETLKVECGCGPVLTSFHQWKGIGSPYNWMTGWTGNQGNFRNGPLYSGAEYNDFSLRLLFHRGWQDIIYNQVEAPFGGSFSYYSPALEIANALYSMRWDGPGQIARFEGHGLFEHFWKDWFNWRSRTINFEFTKILTALDLMNLDFTKKYRVFNINCLLDEVTITITENGIKPAVIKAWTV